MKTQSALAILLALSLGFSSLIAADKVSQTQPPRTATTPGVELAQTISMITGVAISPLLGVSAVGAWRYFHTPTDRRTVLPWFAQPWFWLPALLLVVAVFSKDALGPVIPTALKKPFDMAELFENKLSALVAGGAFVPFVISVFPGASGVDSATTSAPVLATIDLATLGNAVIAPFAIAVFAIVWLASHAINILVLISPFGTVDAALKGLRLFLLSTITATSFVNPYVGAVWALIVIAGCYLIGGWSFRMMVFGTVFAWDMLTLRRKRYALDLCDVWAFTSRQIHKVPIRTYGRLIPNAQGRLTFRYRPWLVLGSKTLILPERCFAVGRGFVSPSLLSLEDNSAISLFCFPPRCCTHEEALAWFCGCSEVRDVGLRGMWRWFLELCGLRSRTLAASVQAA